MNNIKRMKLAMERRVRAVDRIPRYHRLIKPRMWSLTLRARRIKQRIRVGPPSVLRKQVQAEFKYWQGYSRRFKRKVAEERATATIRMNLGKPLSRTSVQTVPGTPWPKVVTGRLPNGQFTKAVIVKKPFGR